MSEKKLRAKQMREIRQMKRKKNVKNKNKNGIRGFGETRFKMRMVDSPWNDDVKVLPKEAEMAQRKRMEGDKQRKNMWMEENQGDFENNQKKGEYWDTVTYTFE